MPGHKGGGMGAAGSAHGMTVGGTPSPAGCGRCGTNTGARHGGTTATCGGWATACQPPAATGGAAAADAAGGSGGSAGDCWWASSSSLQCAARNRMSPRPAWLVRMPGVALTN